MNLSPVWGTWINAGIGILGVLESTGVTDMLSSGGGKAGIIAATVLAFLNAGAHSVSSAKPGPLASAPPAGR